MPGPPLFTDNHVSGDLIKALRHRGWDVDRAVDRFGQKNDDAELFAHAAKEARVFLTCDEGIHAIAHDRLKQGRTDFRMLYCAMERQQDMTVGQLLAAIEAILRKPDAFAYPIEYVKPKLRVSHSRTIAVDPSRRSGSRLSSGRSEAWWIRATRWGGSSRPRS